MSTILEIILIQLTLQEFKQVGGDHHLYVRPGETFWSIAEELHGHYIIYLRGGLANTTCPAHPSSSLDQEVKPTNWEYYDDSGGWLKAELLLR